jgi:hypothetical protein
MTLPVRHPVTARQRLALALLAVAGWAIGQRMELSGDLRKFMPARLSTQFAMASQAAPVAGNLQGALS